MTCRPCLRHAANGRLVPYSLATTSFFGRLNAITRTTDETGLGGTTDWRGLWWTTSIEQFYEAWVETVFERFTRRFGGLLRVGHRRETITPIAWGRAYLGSQTFLLPDLAIEQEDRLVLVDAKSMDHWEKLRERRWLEFEEEIRERHREDLLLVWLIPHFPTAKLPQPVWRIRERLTMRRTATASRGGASGLTVETIDETATLQSLVLTGHQQLGATDVVSLTWTNTGTACLLESTGALPGGWSTVTTPWRTNGNWVSTEVTHTSAAQFFRLRGL